MVQLLNSIYLGAAKPGDYGKAAGVVELLPFDYYLGAAVPGGGQTLTASENCTEEITQASTNNLELG